MVWRLERKAGVADFEPVGIADHLHRRLHAVAAVHQGIDQRLAQGAQRDDGRVAALQLAFFQPKALGQVIQHRGLGAAQRREQRRAQLTVSKRRSGCGTHSRPGTRM
jgi:hypothetical protein